MQTPHDKAQARLRSFRDLQHRERACMFKDQGLETLWNLYSDTLLTLPANEDEMDACKREISAIVGEISADLRLLLEEWANDQWEHKSPTDV